MWSQIIARVYVTANIPRSFCNRVFEVSENIFDVRCIPMYWIKVMIELNACCQIWMGKCTLLLPPHSGPTCMSWYKYEILSPSLLANV